MHYLVRFIVEATDADEANDRTSSILNDLVEQHEFDWYTEDADNCRWDDCWSPCQLDSEKGREMVTEAMASNFEDFKHAMEAVRRMVNDYTDEQIFNEEFENKQPMLYLSRYQLSKASGYHGYSCQLFDNNGRPVISHRELELYLKDPKGLWVVQVDCHN